MNKTTIQDIAINALEYFTLSSTDGFIVNITSRAKPDWFPEVEALCHSSSKLSKWFLYSSLVSIANKQSPDINQYQYVGTREATNWLNEDISRRNYCNEYISESIPSGVYFGIVDILKGAIKKESQQVHHNVKSTLFTIALRLNEVKEEDLP